MRPQQVQMHQVPSWHMRLCSKTWGVVESGCIARRREAWRHASHHAMAVMPPRAQETDALSHPGACKPQFCRQQVLGVFGCLARIALAANGSVYLPDGWLNSL